MSEISVSVVGSTSINPTVGNGDTVNVTIASTGERGPTGATGSAGPANTLTIGTVTQGAADATITGTSPNQVLNLVLQKGDAGTAATNIELQATGTHIQWRLVGGSTWTNLVALSAITGPTGSTGAAGAAVELQTSGTHIQWRYVGGSAWTNVVALSSLVGATGATGATGPQGPAGSVNLADETPQPLGTASAGTALTAARADHVHAVGSVTYSSLSGIPSTFAPSAHQHAVSDVTGLQTALDGKQAAGTYATLVSGTVPSSQLPSYVDDVIEYANLAAFTEQSTGKIYVARDTGKIYRWSGSAYVEISPSPGSTDSVTEGSTNLYHTTARAAAAAPVQSVNMKTGALTLTASDVGAAATSHTHSLANLTQSSATTGQVPTWNGTAWEAATPSGGGGGSYTLPTASDTVLGGIKVGSGLSIAGGVLSATGGGGGGSLSATVTIPARGDQYWSNTQLLLQGDTVADSSSYARTVTAYGGATVSTSQKKFGTGALSFASQGDYYAIPSSADLSFGTGDFTVEAWIRPTAFPANNADTYLSCFFGRQTPGNHCWRFELNGTASSFSSLGFTGMSDSNVGLQSVTAPYSFALNQWYHVAASRISGVLYMFIDGVLQNSGGSSFSISIQSAATDLRVGALMFDGTYKYQFFGQIDDARITKGTGRYAATFTPPTATYGTGAYTAAQTLPVVFS